MSELEMTELCAVAMEFKVVYPGESVLPIAIESTRGAGLYDPLHDDAQAMALVKNVELMIWPPRFNKGKVNWIVRAEDDNQNVIAQTTCPDLNRAIVECVAKMEASANDSD